MSDNAIAVYLTWARSSGWPTVHRSHLKPMAQASIVPAQISCKKQAFGPMYNYDNSKNSESHGAVRLNG